jgi:hypothetical protein
LEVFNIDADGSASVPRYYRFEQLLTLPQITVKTATDPNTQQPATYTGFGGRENGSASLASVGSEFDL